MDDPSRRRKPAAYLISNARCLTEGVDVPAVDVVAFLSPRKSKVDIVQATGRAMRKADEVGKEFGYVLLPLFLPSRFPQARSRWSAKKSRFTDIHCIRRDHRASSCCRVLPHPSVKKLS